MAENSKIEWTDHTFNGWIGCTKTSPGCDHCYAENLMDARMGKAKWGAGQPRVRTTPANWTKPLRWNAQHDAFFAKHGRRQRVFCSSLADVFDNEVPRQWRQDLFDVIIATPNLDWLLLTKRVGNAHRMLNEIAVARGELLTANDEYRPPANVWIGATIVNQEEADRDIPKLLRTPAAVRFLSMEPLLGPVRLDMLCAPADRVMLNGLTGKGGTGAVSDFDFERGVDWVIVGGESGTQARPMHPEWARMLRDQCAAANVPYLFKQWGEWEIASAENGHYDCDMARNNAHWVHIDGVMTKPSYHREDVQQEVSDQAYGMVKAGKSKTGRLLDGVQHDGYPQAAQQQAA